MSKKANSDETKVVESEDAKTYWFGTNFMPSDYFSFSWTKDFFAFNWMGKSDKTD